MSAVPPVPDGLDIYEDHRGEVIASVIAPAVIAGIAVVLRIWARYISSAKFSWDDIFIVLALVRLSSIPQPTISINKSKGYSYWKHCRQCLE